MKELFEKFANQINANMTNIQKTLQHLEEKTEKIETNLQQLEEKTEKIEANLLQLEEKTEKIEMNLQQLDERTQMNLQQLDEKFEARFQNLEKKFDELRADNEEFKQQMLNRHFVFEQEYGQKINAIYDAVTLELDKNLEKSEKISKLNTRMDRAEINVFNHEKRISKLELGS